MVFCHSNIFSAIFNLIPSKVNYLGMLEPNDALKLIQIPFYNEKQLQEFLISARILHASDLIRGKKYTEAKEILEKTEEIAPLNIAVRILIASIYITELKIKKAQNIYRELLNNLGPSEEKFKYIIMYELAYLSLFDNNDNCELADNYSKQVYNHREQHIPYKIIRGCVLVNSERVDEGITILRNCVNLEKGIDRTNNNTLAFIYLAYAFYKKGNIVKAIEHIKVAEIQINKLDKDVKHLYDKIINKTSNFDREQYQN